MSLTEEEPTVVELNAVLNAGKPQVGGAEKGCGEGEDSDVVRREGQLVAASADGVQH